MRYADDERPEPEAEAPCGCPTWDCSPAEHEGERYCQACDKDLPPAEWTPMTHIPDADDLPF